MIINFFNKIQYIGSVIIVFHVRHNNKRQIVNQIANYLIVFLFMGQRVGSIASVIVYSNNC